MTHLRLGLACVFALVCAIGFALPAAAPAGEQIADPYFKDQWALDNGSKPDIDIVQAWQVSEGAGVTVAVVDQEVDAEHPDLIGGIAPAGRDFTAPGGCSITEPTGVEDHGTYIAGLIAARRENGVAIAGVAPEATILPLRAVDNCGESNADWIGNALTHAGEAGVPIVIAAFGTDPGQLTPGDAADYNALFLDIFSRFSNTLFVVPAGNEGNDNDALPVYPCSTADPASGESPPNLICVGATNETDFPMCYGNVGGRSVDLFAPGSRIISTVRGKDIVQASGGTSAAAGIVAGVAALVKATDEEATPESIKFALMNSVGDPRTPGLIPISVSGGRVNAARAVERRGNLSPNGPGGTWKTCDPDHDGLTLDADDCPAQFGPAAYRGCPDSDGDGRRDINDNCPSTPNPDQADHDGDGIGTACDPTPRGEDVDGDGVPRLDDQCPTVYGTLANGCPEPLRPQPTETPGETPTPTPAPRAGVATVTVKVSRCPRGRKSCLKTAKVTVRLTSAAKASLRFEQRVKRGRKLVWRRYTVKSLNASTSARSYTLKRLKKGSYRVIVTVAGTGKTKHFTVR